ncbi:hypothetical protein M9H77_03320 [Catharanthus roseus]|uniref:Uncharacterized protein n=1 Tax=Catharanthus roseus TaxID=4058 RepID=A0ACC0CB61_CATRO|nr:hypothetical protein M9H77_03320 [Catharanthus roseus]
MEEVPAHVHPGPIVPDVLTRQHKHRFGLTGSGDHATCFTDLQCRRFGRNLFQSYSTTPCTLVKKEPLEVWILRAFTGSETDDDLILRARGFNFLLLGGHILLDFLGSLVHVRYLSLLEDFDAISTYSWVEVLSYPKDEYIRWYRDITQVYIGNPANRDTHTVGYHPAGVNRRMMEVDDMASRVIQEPLSSPSQIASFAKKVQTIIRMCMVSIGGTLGCTTSQHNIQQTFLVQPSRRRPQEPVPDRGARGVKRGARRLPGGGARGGRSLAPPDLGRGHINPGRGGEMGEAYGGRELRDLGSSYQVEPFDSLDLGMPSFTLGLMPPTQSHPPISYAPPPSYAVGSSTQYMPISTTSSSDSDEHDDETTDVVTPAQ